ncbi:hypothetical protein Ae263Ps1_3663 [Pseudonocardia sp. Ae263_Ps1]|nr:hypothetical protein Ae263Ps1_3663 [Pseudonocardia sp. Ae263_Ps1]
MRPPRGRGPGRSGAGGAGTGCGSSGGRTAGGPGAAQVDVPPGHEQRRRRSAPGAHRVPP